MLIPTPLTPSSKAMINIDQLKEDLIRDEGLRLRPYRDSTGNTTWGVGRNLSAKPLKENEAAYLLTKGNFTREDALRILEGDIADALFELHTQLPWVQHLPETKQRALANMVFNLGIAGLLKFKPTLALMREGRWPDAVGRLKKSLWAKQVGKRSERVCDLLLES
jgi:lysozyme